MVPGEKKKKKLKKRRYKSEIVLVRHEHKVRIDPFKLYNMENILNKVCVEKKDMGT